MAPAVSIVIPTLGRPAHLAACLDSIALTVRAAHEVIAVAVESDTPTMEVLGSRPGVRVFTHPERVGFVRAANAGFREAEGEWLCHLNDDCRLMPHAIDNALFFAGAPDHRDAGQIAFFHDSPAARNVFSEITVEGVRYAVSHVRGLPFANFGLTRRAVAEGLGLFDERFRMYGADPDLSLRIWFEARRRVLPCPGALVRHASLEDERGADERAAQGEDNRLLFEKWNLAPPGS